MVDNKLNKKGFTLVEILVALIILMVFFVAAAKILTIKPKRHYPTSVHGMFECYLEDSSLKSHEVYEAYSSEAVTQTGDSCLFTPSKNVATYTIIVVFPNSNDNKGQAYIDIQPAISRPLYLYPADSIIKNDYGVEGYSSLAPMLDKDELKTYLNTTYQNSKVIDIADTTLNGAIIVAW